MKAQTFLKAVESVFRTGTKKAEKIMLEGTSSFKEDVKIPIAEGIDILRLTQFYSQPFHPEMLAHLKEEPNFLNYGKPNIEKYEHDLKMWKGAEIISQILFSGWDVNELDGFNYSTLDESKEKKGCGLYHIGYYISHQEYSIYGGLSDTIEFPFKPRTLDEFICDCEKAGVSLFWTDNVLENIFNLKLEHLE